MKRSLLLLVLIVSAVFAACAPVQQDSEWYDSGKDVNDEFVDVFYICSTEVLESRDNGRIRFRAVLSEDEKANIGREMKYVEEKMFPDSVNFFSPYYHQYTMEAIFSPRIDHIWKEVSRELCELFDEYMHHYNGGRRFILAGYSQGGTGVIDILRHMTDEQFSRLVAAYSIGYRISADDVADFHVIPAESRYDRGVTVAFNSVQSPELAWDFVSKDAFCTINPVSWRTDDTPAAMSYPEYGLYLTFAADPATHQIVVSGAEDVAAAILGTSPKTIWPRGNLHGVELQLYKDCIRRNVLDRAYFPY